jgi:hypothetical protein
MALTWKNLIQVLVTVMRPIVTALTPAIKTALSDFLTDLYRKAVLTENPWDDYLMGLLLDILGIPRPGPVQ